jgi:putative ABC transport system substrate-binding protein
MIARRAFISLVGGAAAAWPLAARAQRSAMPVIGLLSARTPETDAALLGFFRQGLHERGYVEGHNVAIEYRWALGDYARLPALAAEFVHQSVAVIATFGGPSPALAAKAKTATIPILFVISGDPVKNGLSENLNRPTSNVTGVSTLFEDIGPKQLGLAYELLPNAKKIAVLINPNSLIADKLLSDIRDAAKAMLRDVQMVHAGTPSEIDPIFAKIHSTGADGLLVPVDPFFFTQMDQIAASGMRYRVPTVFFRREFAQAGGLMSYGSDPQETYRQIGIYAGRLLSGAKPSELPIVQSAKFELVINLTTAKAMGVEIPPMLLARADEVIE